VEARLTALERLKRKHGGPIAAVLAHAERCRARRDELASAEVALESGQAELAEAEAELDKLAAALGRARRDAAPRLAEAVRERLGELAMEGATFSVALEPREEPGPAGAEGVEFRLAPNPGVPDGPLRDIASGGELSRVMLALEVVLAASAEGTTMVFDEVDAGVGGRAAVQIGRRLARLARTHQVIVVTHLPQVAAYADVHLVVDSGGGRSKSSGVRRLDDDDRVAELARMLAGLGESDSGRAHARELLDAAQNDRAD
jgi:DNA repair protein RecN (Recombination protein N)